MKVLFAFLLISNFCFSQLHPKINSWIDHYTTIERHGLDSVLYAFCVKNRPPDSVFYQVDNYYPLVAGGGSFETGMVNIDANCNINVVGMDSLTAIKLLLASMIMSFEEEKNMNDRIKELENPKIKYPLHKPKN